MTGHKNMAIVLKSYLPQKHKLCLLDDELGKIMAVPNRDDIGYGAFIMYQTREQNGMYFMHAIEIIDLPLVLGRDDILFVHHVLELCYFFIPLGEQVTGLCQLLVKLYNCEKMIQNVQAKKVFLFQFFASLGLYPDGVRFQTPYFHKLAFASIDNIALYPIDLMIEQELDSWLMSCIALHPCTHNFKTVHFLQQNRIL
jgi:hypothetical protein